MSTASISAWAMARPDDPHARSLLELMESGGLPTMAHLAPIVAKAIGEMRRPVVLDGFPRMSSQLKQLEAELGEVRASTISLHLPPSPFISLCELGEVRALTTPQSLLDDALMTPR